MEYETNGKPVNCFVIILYSLILGTFAAINAASGLLSIALGNRRVVHKLTCGTLGKPDSKGYLFTWPLYIGLQIGGNALVALLMKSAPGYLGSFRIGELVVFLTARLCSGEVAM